MTRYAGLVLSLFLATSIAAADGAVPPPPAKTPAPLALRDAVKQGLVAAKGVSPISYRGITLVLKNNSGRPIEIDLCGSYLKPRTGGSCQRLGLGPTVDPRVRLRRGAGRVVVALAAGGTRRIAMRTVCLDSGKSAPRDQEFGPATAALPPVREKVLRWWADNPTASQGAVNCAIWQFRDTVHVGPGVVESYEHPRGKSPAVFGGVYYRLEDGELMSRDGEGLERFLGTEIFRAFPRRDGVYAIGLGEGGRPELWLHSMTGDRPWHRVRDLDVSVRVLDILPQAEGRLLLVTTEGIRICEKDRADSRLVFDARQILDMTVHQADARRVLVSVKEPGSEGLTRGGKIEHQQADRFGLYRLDVPTGKTERLKRYWTVKSLAAGEAGVYAISHRGLLKRLRGLSPKTLERGRGQELEYDRILQVGRKVLWLRTESGRLACTDARSGRVRFVRDLDLDADTPRDIDPVTDDLAFVEDGEFRRIRAKDGSMDAP